MWREQLETIRGLEHSFGGEIPLGADVEAVEAFCNKVKQEYGVELSPGYKEFLCCADGFDFNGHVLLGTTEDEDDYLSMIGINKMFHKNEELRRYWFYGMSDMDWYVFDKSIERYLAIDAAENVSHELSTADELIGFVLTESVSN